MAQSHRSISHSVVMTDLNLVSDILDYIVRHQLQPGDRLPTIPELSQELEVSVSKVREELAVARSLGLVQIKPRTGTQIQPYDFGPAASLSVIYALGLNQKHFYDFARLRTSVELGFWYDAVSRLAACEITELRGLVDARIRLYRESLKPIGTLIRRLAWRCLPSCPITAKCGITMRVWLNAWLRGTLTAGTGRFAST